MTTEGPMQPDEPAFPQTAEALRLLASPSLPPEARARHLYALRERAAVLGAPAEPLAPVGLFGEAWRRRWRRVATVAGAWTAAASLGTGVAAAAAMDDLPGDPLYGLKRAVEVVRLHLPGDDVDAVHRRLDLAERRLAEAQALRERGREGALVQDALAASGSLLEEAAELAAGDRELAGLVAERAARTARRLAELLDSGLPERAADRAREAIGEAAQREREHDEDDEPEPDDARERGRQGHGAKGQGVAVPDGGDDEHRGRGRDEQRRPEPAAPAADAEEGEKDEADAEDEEPPEEAEAKPDEASQSGDQKRSRERGRSSQSGDDDGKQKGESSSGGKDDGGGQSQSEGKGKGQSQGGADDGDDDSGGDQDED